MPIVSARVAMGPTAYAKRNLAGLMYRKGQGFAVAAMLFHERKTQLANSDAAFESVFLHLVCQAIEVTLKGLLLFRDYDRYQPMLKALGHNLDKVVQETLAAYCLNPMRPALEKELVQLNAFYSRHLLRYSSIRDHFNNPHAIERDMIVRRLRACLRLADRELESFRDRDRLGGHVLFRFLCRRATASMTLAHFTLHASPRTTAGSGAEHACHGRSIRNAAIVLRPRVIARATPRWVTGGHTPRLTGTPEPCRRSTVRKSGRQTGCRTTAAMRRSLRR